MFKYINVSNFVVFIYKIEHLLFWMQMLLDLETSSGNSQQQHHFVHTQYDTNEATNLFLLCSHQKSSSLTLPSHLTSFHSFRHNPLWQGLHVDLQPTTPTLRWPGTTRFQNRWVDSAQASDLKLIYIHICVRHMIIVMENWVGFCFGVREEVGEVALRDREDPGRLWRVQWELG